MFVRSVKVKTPSGVVHEYLRIVSSVRNGKAQPQQKVVANLGRRDLLESILPQLQRFLRGESTKDPLSALDQELPVQMLEAATWGPMLFTRFCFEALGLWDLLEGSLKRPKRRGQSRLASPSVPEDWVSRVCVLVANRLAGCPCSEHGLARWLETDYVCDRVGRRYRALWKEQGRVKVALKQLQRWYRTLDQLLAHQSAIEVGLYQRLRDLFSLEPKLVFYDLTSTYFEGAGPEGFAMHGHSRDGKPRHRQVVVGVVMVAGWPIAHHVWAGNRNDKTTVAEVVADLSKRFEFKQVVLVGDRGMVSQSNFEALKNTGESGDFGYLWGMVRRRNPKVQELIDATKKSSWVECPGGINAQEKHPPPRTRAQEVKSPDQGVRYIVVESEERAAYEQGQRQKAMQKVQKELEGVKQRVARGQLKRPEKIGAAVERVLQRRHGYRYYAWKINKGQLEYFEHPVNLEREKMYEGKYLIQTDQPQLSVTEVVEQYKELNEVERGFRSLKDPIGVAMRPIYHRKADRVKAHIFVAAIAFLFERYLERQLKAAKVKLSASEALGALQTIRWVRFKVQEKERGGVTPGSARAQQVLKALGIQDLRPPVPPEGQETTM